MGHFFVHVYIVCILNMKFEHLPTLEMIYIYHNDVLSVFIMCLCKANNFVMQHFEVHNYDVFKI